MTGGGGGDTENDGKARSPQREGDRRLVGSRENKTKDRPAHRPLLQKREEGKQGECQWKNSAKGGKAEEEVGKKSLKVQENAYTMQEWKRQNGRVR